MEEGEQATKPWIRVQDLLRKRDRDALEAFFDDLSVGESARAISRLSERERDILFVLLDPEDAAEIIEEIPSAEAVQIIENLDPGEAASIVDELSSADQADLLAELDAEEADAILAEMDPTMAAAARKLADYDPETAGGLMLTEFLAFNEECRVREVLDNLNLNSKKYSDFAIQYLYVTDQSGALTGVLPLRALVLSDPETPISSQMIRNPIHVPITMTLTELRDLFDRSPLLGVPVTDRSNRMVGVVRGRAVVEALTDRSDTDHLKTQGIVGGDELRTMPVALRSRRRLAWLSINIFLNLIAASVIAMYQDTLQYVIALAIFLPIISDMSGCSGNQAVAVSMRELSLGIVRPYEWLYVWLKEISVGLINGCCLGVMIGLVAWFWQGDPILGLVVGVALAVNTVIAVSIGGTIPLLLKRMNLDPALASGPILTTITDMFGFFLVLSIATLLLPLMKIGGLPGALH